MRTTTRRLVRLAAILLVTGFAWFVPTLYQHLGYEPHAFVMDRETIHEEAHQVWSWLPGPSVLRRPVVEARVRSFVPDFHWDMFADALNVQRARSVRLEMGSHGPLVVMDPLLSDEQRSTCTIDQFLEVSATRF